MSLWLAFGLIVVGSIVGAAMVALAFVRDAPMYGFLSMAHEMRTDWAMLLGSLVLLVVGGGPWSLDAALARRRRDSIRDAR